MNDSDTPELLGSPQQAAPGNGDRRSRTMPAALRRVTRSLVAFGRPHAAAFRWGCLSALLVVAARLLLPWPLHGLLDYWKPAGEGVAPVADSLVFGIERHLALGLGFLGALVLLGLGDALERVQFARFAIATVKDLRKAALASALERSRQGGTRRPGDLVARLIGDTARVKAGLKGFLVHVATNSVLFTGVTLVLLRVNVKLGLVFGAAGLGTAIVTVFGARALYDRTRRYRKKEGLLADEIDKAFRRRSGEAGFGAANESSAVHEAHLARLQALTTWSTYAIFGVAVLTAVWLGGRDIAAGVLEPSGLIVFLVYALIMRGPMVRLARQGSRLGKIVATADRVVRVVHSPVRAPAPEPRQPSSTPQTRPPELSLVSKQPKIRVLFTGYAPVQFLCFKPLYDRLAARDDVEIELSGGIDHTTEQGVVHDHAAMYGPLGVPAEQVRSVAEIKERDYDFLFAGNTTLISPRSVKNTVQIFHGLSFRNRGVRPDNMGCDYYFVIGPYQRRLLVDGEMLAEGDPRALEIGFMKTDDLVQREYDMKSLREQLGFTGDRPILLFAPTGQKYNALETMGEEVLERLTESGRYDVILKPHDHAKNRIDWFSRLARFEGPHCRIVRDLDVMPYLQLADLLLSDASSVSNEFLLTDRPIVFLDVPRLLKKANRKKDANVDLETWGRKIGRIAEGPDDLLQVIDESLSDPGALSDVRRAAAADFFYNPGHSTDHALDWFLKVAGLEAGVAPAVASEG